MTEEYQITFSKEDELYERIEKLEKENAELKVAISKMEITTEKNSEVAELKAQIEKMKKTCIDVMKVQGENLTDNYMAGMYNGMVVVYNSVFLNENETEMDCCKKNKYDKWEIAK